MFNLLDILRPDRPRQIGQESLGLDKEQLNEFQLKFLVAV